MLGPGGKAMSFPKEKINVVRSYLKSRFPSCKLDDRFDYTRHAQAFFLSEDEDQHTITVYSEFFNTHSAAEIEKILKSRQFDQYFRELHKERVIISNKGVNLLS